MVSSLSNLVNNLAKEIHKVKCKYGQGNKNAKRVKLNAKIVSVVLNIKTLKTI